MRNRSGVCVLAGMMALCLSSAPALALDPYDAPILSCVSSGENQITLRIQAGASGAPAGVSVHWMTRALYDELGGWVSSDDPRLCRLSLSGQPSLQHPGASRWDLGPNESSEITMGDINFDETGVSGQSCGLDPLECSTEYVFRAFAHAGRRMGRSDWSTDVFCTTADCPVEDCTFTQGYWKNHGPTGCLSGNNSNEWGVTSLTLGTVNYTDLQLCSIFNKPSGGNGLLNLAHQLIAAKLNVANGCGCDAVDAAIAAADALVGNKVAPPVGAGSMSPGSTSALTLTLDQFNNGILAGCPGHARSEHLNPRGRDVTPSTWGEVKSRYGLAKAGVQGQ